MAHLVRGHRTCISAVHAAPHVPSRPPKSALRHSPHSAAAPQHAGPPPASSTSAAVATAEHQADLLRSRADAALRRMMVAGQAAAAPEVEAAPCQTRAAEGASQQQRQRCASSRAGGGRVRRDGSTSSGQSSRRGGAAAAAAALPVAPVPSAGSSEEGGGATCAHCRFPCHAGGLPSCDAAEFLKMWNAESYMKPAFFDSTWTGQPPNTSGMAVVSLGGRVSGRWKPQNQDSFLLHAFQGTQVPAIVVGVFDGHGPLGASAARQVRESMLEALERSSLPGASSAATGTLSQEAAEACLLQAYSLAEQRMGEDARDFSKSGTTAVLCMLLRDRIVAAWAGDSRAVVGVRGGAGEGYLAHALTSDHKPDSPSELARIAAMGGRVDRLATDPQGNPMGPFRIFLPGQWAPGLAVARAFGDTMASEIGVTPTPEFAVFELPAAAAEPPPAYASFGRGAARAGSYGDGTFVVAGAGKAARLRGARAVPPPGRGGGRSGVAPTQGGGNALAGITSRPPPPSNFLIVASDGLWEWISSQRAVDIAGACASAEDAAHALVEAAQKEWALHYRGRFADDITVSVAFL